jgi:hypothetical protein
MEEGKKVATCIFSEKKSVDLVKWPERHFPSFLKPESFFSKSHEFSGIRFSPAWRLFTEP